MGSKDYILECLDDYNETNKIAFDIKIKDEWYRTVFKDGYMQSIEKSIFRGTPSQIARNKFEWWDVSDEIENLVNDIVMEWFKDKDIYKPNLTTADYITLLGEYDLNMPQVEIIIEYKSTLMLEHLMSLIYLDKTDDMFQCIDVYFNNLKNGRSSISIESLFKEIDRLTQINMDKITGKIIDRCASKNALIKENNMLSFIKKSILERMAG